MLVSANGLFASKKMYMSSVAKKNASFRNIGAREEGGRKTGEKRREDRTGGGTHKTNTAKCLRMTCGVGANGLLPAAGAARRDHCPSKRAPPTPSSAHLMGLACSVGGLAGCYTSSSGGEARPSPACSGSVGLGP